MPEGGMLPAMDFDVLNDAMAKSSRRAQRGRAIAELMIVLTAGLVAVLGFVFISGPPQCMCPMFESRTEAFGLPWSVIIGMVGFVGLATGLFWMWRIVRADPDPDAPDGRDWAWIPLAIAAVVGAIIGLFGLLVAAVNVISLFFLVMQPGISRPPEPTSTALTAGAAFVVAMIGFSCMVRISRGVHRRGTTVAVSPPSLGPSTENGNPQLSDPR